MTTKRNHGFARNRQKRAQVATMYFIYGYSPQYVAEYTGYCLGTVRDIISRYNTCHLKANNDTGYPRLKGLSVSISQLQEQVEDLAGQLKHKRAEIRKQLKLYKQISDERQLQKSEAHQGSSH